MVEDGLEAGDNLGKKLAFLSKICHKSCILWINFVTSQLEINILHDGNR